MLMIRLQRVGRTNDPSFRVVVTEKSNGPQSGSFLEIVGSYDPRKNRVALKKERIRHWISHGAKTSGTVNNLLVSEKIITGPKVDVRPQKKLTPKEEKPVPASAETSPKTETAQQLASAEDTTGKEEKTEKPKNETTNEKTPEEKKG